MRDRTRTQTRADASGLTVESSATDAPSAAEEPRPDAPVSPTDETNKTREIHTRQDALRPVVPFQLATRDSKRYYLIEEHARGGLGSITRAYDCETGREVALKQMLRWRDEDEVRFTREALITARLEHPSIVPLYDAGRWKSGRPFYAMKFVEGQSLKHAIASKKTLEERMTLLPHVIAVADAMAFAHSKGIIHRDLKPSNVMLGEYGETLVVDWGLAKAVTAREIDEDAATSREPRYLHPPDSDELTRDGSVMGTPSYMSPEQARGEPLNERTDVYALGTILYHVLTGAPPFGGASSAEILRSLQSEPPRSVSVRAAKMPKDLRAIVGKAMAAAPANRYSDAKKLVDDLKRFQEGQLVGARDYSPPERMHRFFATRTRLSAALIGILTTLGVGGSVAVQRVITERDTARKAEHLARNNHAHAVKERNSLLLEKASRLLAEDPTKSIETLAEYPIAAADWSRAHAIASYANTLGVAERVFDAHVGVVVGAAYTVDGSLITQGLDGTIKRWSFSRQAPKVLSDQVEDFGVLQLAQAGDFTAYANRDGIVRVNQRTGQGRRLPNSPSPISSLAVSESGTVAAVTSTHSVYLARDVRGRYYSEQPYHLAQPSHDGELLALASRGSIDVVQLESGRRRRIRTSSPAQDLAFSPSDDRLALSTLDGAVAMIDLASFKVKRWGAPESTEGNRELLHLRLYGRLAWDEAGRRLAHSGNKGAISVWAGKTGTLIYESIDESPPMDIALSPDGRYLAIATPARPIRLVHIDSKSEWAFAGQSTVTNVAFSRDSKLLVSSGRSAEVREWRVPQPLVENTVQLSAPVFYVKNLKDRLMITDGRDGVVREWRAGKIVSADNAGGIAYRLAKHEGSDSYAVAVGGGSIYFGRAGNRSLFKAHEGDTNDVVFLPDGSLVSVGDDGTVAVWDGSHLRVRKTVGNIALLRVAASSEGVAVADRRGTVTVFNSEMSLLHTCTHNGGRVFELRWDYRSHAFVSAGEDGRLVNCSEKCSALIEQDGPIYALASHPHGLLAAAGQAPKVWFRNAKGRDYLLDSFAERIASLEFSDDGRLLAAGTVEGLVRVWDIKTGRTIFLTGHKAISRGIAFLSDGLATVAWDGSLRIWRLTQLLAEAPPREAQLLKKWLTDRADHRSARPFRNIQNSKLK